MNAYIPPEKRKKTNGFTPIHQCVVIHSHHPIKKHPRAEKKTPILTALGPMYNQPRKICITSSLFN